MAKANFVKSARKPIYQKGKWVEYVSKKGKREGQTLSKIDRTIPADENDEIFINIGESYWWWAFQNGPKRFSKDRPKPSQLTQSEFLSEFYSYSEEVEEWECDDVDDFESYRDDMVSNLETMRDNCQEKLDNMPEQLQYAPTGELLQERIDGLDELISELSNIYVEEIEEFEFDKENKEEDEEEQRENWEERKREKVHDVVQEIKDAFGNSCF